MSRDRSLDEFLSDESDAESETDGPADDLEPEPTGGGETASAVEQRGVDEERSVDPIATTYAWSPDGGECGVCGAVVDARWRDGEDLVCEDCKNW